MAPVLFGTPYAFMPGHVLNLPDIVCFQPVHNYRSSDLPAVDDFGMVLFCLFHDFTNHIAMLFGWEQVRVWLKFLDVAFNWQYLVSL